MKKSKQKRYHVDVHFPAWSKKSIELFIENLVKKGSLVFSVHAVEKIIGYSFEYGRQLLKYLLKSVKKVSIESSNVFEFYAVEENINKACLRFSFDEFPVDLVLVISSDGTVITVFTTNKGDNHGSLNIKLYERNT